MLILFFIGAFIGAVLIVAAIAPKHYVIESDVVINKPREEVFQYVVQLKNQIYYNKWMMADPNIQLTYTGADGTVGFTVSWKSELRDVGEGEQELKHIDYGVSYHSELRFEKPFKGISQVYVGLKSITSTQTKVSTAFDTRTGFPMNLMIPLIKKMLKKDMGVNAQNMKKVVEAN